MLIEMQTLNQNSANWKYTVKGSVVFINPAHVKMVVPGEPDDFKLYLVEGDEQYPIHVDVVSFQRLQAFMVNGDKAKYR